MHRRDLHDTTAGAPRQRRIEDELRRPSRKCDLRAARRRRQGRSPQGRAQREPSRKLDSAHHTEHVTIHYRWHPLHGQTISRTAEHTTRS
jgi:hypothetical protein